MDSINVAAAALETLAVDSGGSPTSYRILSFPKLSRLVVYCDGQYKCLWYKLLTLGVIALSLVFSYLALALLDSKREPQAQCEQCLSRSRWTGYKGEESKELLIPRTTIVRVCQRGAM